MSDVFYCLWTCQIPIFHCNGDDPLSVCTAFELAVEWRQQVNITQPRRLCCALSWRVFSQLFRFQQSTHRHRSQTGGTSFEGPVFRRDGSVCIRRVKNERFVFFNHFNERSAAAMEAKRLCVPASRAGHDSIDEIMDFTWSPIFFILFSMYATQASAFVITDRISCQGHYLFNSFIFLDFFVFRFGLFSRHTLCSFTCNINNDFFFLFGFRLFQPTIVQQFGEDCIIDLVCYRRMGHNEIDQPLFTQPVLYKQIAQHPDTAGIYETRLVCNGCSYWWVVLQKQYVNWCGSRGASTPLCFVRHMA